MNQPNGEVINFREMFQVAPEFLDEANSIANKFQSAINPTDLGFDFEKAFQIANSMGVAVPFQGRLIEGSCEVASIVNNGLTMIKDRLQLNSSLIGPPLWNQVEDAITNALINLNTQQNSAWIHFYKETSYHYNVLINIQLEDHMVVLPIAFNINLALDKQRALFLTLKDIITCEISINAALTLVRLPLSQN